MTDGNDGKEGVVSVSLCLRSQSPSRMDVREALRRVSLMTGHTHSELWRETWTAEEGQPIAGGIKLFCAHTSSASVSVAVV